MSQGGGRHVYWAGFLYSSIDRFGYFWCLVVAVWFCSLSCCLYWSADFLWLVRFFGLASLFSGCSSLFYTVHYVIQTYTTELSTLTTGEAALVRLLSLVAAEI